MNYQSKEKLKGDKQIIMCTTNGIKLGEKCKKYGISRQAIVAYRQHNGGTYDEALEKVIAFHSRLNYIFSKVKHLGVTKIAIRQYIKNHKDLDNDAIVDFYNIDKQNINSNYYLRTFAKDYSLNFNTLLAYKRKYKLTVDETIDYYRRKIEKRKQRIARELEFG